MQGCPYSKFSFKLMEEQCEVTKELTHYAILCDFDFEGCPHYQSRQTCKINQNDNIQITQDERINAFKPV